MRRSEVFLNWHAFAKILGEVVFHFPDNHGSAISLDFIVAPKDQRF